MPSDGVDTHRRARSKRVFLHIGTHKTGTTAIQAFLMKNEQGLRQQGILFPVSGRPERDASVGFGHHLLARSLTGGHGIEVGDVWPPVVAEIAGWAGNSGITGIAPRQRRRYSGLDSKTWDSTRFTHIICCEIPRPAKYLKKSA